MARRRMVHPVDTSDRLANLVLGSLLVGLVALFGLVALLDSEDAEPSEQAATATEVPTVSGGVATADPSPTAVPGATRETAAAGDQTGAPDGEAVPDEAVVPDAERVPAQPPVAPLQPRGERSDPSGATTSPPVTTPDDDGDLPDDRVVEGAQPDDEVVPDVPPEDDGTADGGVQPDAPVAPASGIDDPDRVPALVISDRPIDVRTVVADLDGNRVPERVHAAIVSNSVAVEVERYASAGSWREVAATTGAVADDLVGLWVRDVTGDGRPEIYTKQWVGTYGESVTLWSFSGNRLRPMMASGGCWDSENTFGVVGARVRRDEVVAICEESPLPPELWSTAVYRWRDGRWTFQERVGVYNN